MHDTLIRVGNFFTSHAPAVALGGLLLLALAVVIAAVVIGGRR